MKIRVLKSFGVYKSGQEFDWPAGMCRLFVARGMVEEIRESAPVIEAAAVEPAVETATVKKKRRPR
jgi:hypothetical protein